MEKKQLNYRIIEKQIIGSPIKLSKPGERGDERVKRSSYLNWVDKLADVVKEKSRNAVNGLNTRRTAWSLLCALFLSFSLCFVVLNKHQKTFLERGFEQN